MISDDKLNAIEKRHEEDGQQIGKDPDKTILLAEVKASRERERRLEEEVDKQKDLTRSWLDASKNLAADLRECHKREKELEERLEAAQLRSIEARNPGIDMERVKRERTRRLNDDTGTTDERN